MNDQLPENKSPTPSEILRQWADKLEKNSPEDFSGVFVIVPPKGDPLSGLLLDKDADLGTFFALLQSKISDAIEKTAPPASRKGW